MDSTDASRPDGNAADRPPVRIRLRPLGKTLTSTPGTPMINVLFPEGVEFPCGGRGRCRGCRVRVLEGELPVSPEEQRLLTPDQIGAGWRLACRQRVEGDLTLDLAQWESAVLADESSFHFTPHPGCGIAIDVGTTTLAAQLVDLETGRVLAVRTGLNRQARFGADLMSRLSFAMTSEGASTLASRIRTQLGELIGDLLAAAGGEHAERVKRIVLVGNTAMHHLFGALDPEPLARYPFETPTPGTLEFDTGSLGWKGLPEGCRVVFLPCIGGFVGSDVLAGLLATGFDRRDKPGVFIDLGTNGEIVVGNYSRMVCASTAAGPAFEGARITMGMRASTGAIAEVEARGESWHCRVLGDGEPRGLCGSGLVDAVATGLDLGVILSNGRYADGGDRWTLREPVALHQCDVRELQLAKGAIAAGARTLLKLSGLRAREVSDVYLAGAFGNYLRLDSARRIGLLPFGEDKLHPSGNTALLGAKLSLFSEHPQEACESLRKRIVHFSLGTDPDFQEAYIEEMGFPRKRPPAHREKPKETRRP